MTHPGIPSSPLSDRVDCFNHDRFRGYAPVHFRSGLLPSCLRFAVYVTGHHARLGARLLARLCRHLGRLSSIRLQGATPSDPIVYHMYRVTSWEGGEPVIIGDEHSELTWKTFDAAAAIPDLPLQEYRNLFTKLG